MSASRNFKPLNHHVLPFNTDSHHQVKENQTECVISKNLSNFPHAHTVVKDKLLQASIIYRKFNK